MEKRKCNIFTHKFLPLFGLFCFILFCFAFSNVKAYENTYNNNSFYMPDEMLENIKSLNEYSRVGSDYNLVIMQDLYRDNRYLVYFLPLDVKIWHTSYWQNRGFQFNPTTNWVVYEYNSSMQYVGKVAGFNWAELPVNLTNNSFTVYSTVDIYNDSSCSSIFLEGTTIAKAPPYIINSEEISSNNFDYLYISSGDYTITNIDTLDLIITNEYIYTLGDLEGFVDISQYQQYLVLNSSSPYYRYNEESKKSFFVIPKEDITVFRNIDGESYRFQIYAPDLSLAYDNSFTIGIIFSEDKETQNLIAEGNQTNKNIFQKIGDIFNILNPFSDSFFGKTLVNLIIDGLKGLFIPENGYFDSYFQELQDWFSDRLGFLYYPLDLLFSLFDRFLELGNGSLSINIPEIKEPFTGLPFIKAQTLDFNELLANETLSGMHNIYLLIMDASIYIGLVVLLYHKYEEVVAS